MNSVIISWGLFLTLAGGVYWVYLSPKSAATKLHAKPIVEDKGAGGIFLNASGTEGTEKKKKKKKKPTPNNTAPKDIISTDDGFKAAESTDDDDVAQEEDQAELLRRLQSLREGSNSGGKKPVSASSSTRQLAPQKPALGAPTSPFATASQTSSAGADADIDEEEATRLPGSDYAPQQSLSSDPSDMLESSTGGPGVLKITSSAQLPRPPKQKTTNTASQSGVHSSKNAKKKEKKKSEKEAEKADQKARFELHRATMRATEVAKQNKPLQSVTPPSAWTSNDQAPSTAPKSATNELLDTFATPVAKSAPVVTQQTTTDSEEEKQQMRSTHLDDSYWEEIPAHLIGGGWNEVPKKGRKQKKAAGEVQTGDESTDARSGKETIHSKSSAGRVPGRAPSKAVKPVVQKKVTPASGNGFQLLDTGSATSNTNNSSSDWAEVDDLENWAVHPEE